MRKIRAIVLAASAGLAGLTPLLLPAVAQAQGTAAAPGKAQAKKLFEEGVALEKKSDFAGALAKYTEAGRIVETPGLRFHAGYCLEMTGKLAAAVDEYEAADKLAHEQSRPEVHAAVTARLEPLRPRVPQMVLHLTPRAKDAEVQLDAEPVGATRVDGEAFRTDPGEHTVTARASGYKAFSRTVQVPEGVTTTIDVSLERVPSVVVAPVAGAAVAPVPPPPGVGAEDSPKHARGRSVALPILATVGTVVLAGAGVGLFLASGSVQSDAQRSCVTEVSCSGEQSKVRTLDAVALGSFIAAAGLAVVSVVLWTSKGPERATSSARVTAGPGAASFVGTF